MGVDQGETPSLEISTVIIINGEKTFESKFVVKTLVTEDLLSSG